MLSKLLSFILWLVGFFKPSSDKQLGKVEQIAETQEKTIQEVRLSNEVQQSVDALKSGDAMLQLRKSWMRK